jgi:hypothetical protein
VFTTINTIPRQRAGAGAQADPQLYDAGVDALIVQDLGVMELDIPPIELHASTQTDIRTLARAKFLDQAGFSQLVLARELNLQEIRAIADETDAAIEFFIHGALCVAFSGQCNISHAQTGRSANRGDCSQACRLPYTLKDEKGAWSPSKAPAVDEGQQPERQPPRPGRCRRALVQDRRALQGHGLCEEHHRLPPAPGRHPRRPPGPGPRLQRPHRHSSCPTRTRPSTAAAPTTSSATARSTSAPSTRRPSPACRWAWWKKSASATCRW